MARIRLLINRQDPTSFTATYLQPVWSRYFDIEEYDPDRISQYNKTDTLVVAGKFNTSLWYRPLQDRGLTVIIENLWERAVDTNHPDCYILSADYWFRYNEPLWYKYLGYDNYIPKPNYKYTAFMPIRNRKTYRDQFLEELGTRLDTMLYSYVSRGIYLPNDLPNDLENPGGDFQRYFNPDWYNSTHYSLVVESAVSNDDRLFVSEKSYKPIAFKHPFMVWGQRWNLWTLRKQGFQTYDNLWDESYDNIYDPAERMKLLLTSIDQYQPRPYDQLTLEKIEHNHALFYNNDQIIGGIVGDVINPMLELV